MNWVKKYQLFLFDFDGLLVNTEHIHFQAYVNACAKKGFRLDWTFPQFCSVAHVGGSAFREEICALFPALDADWKDFYETKKREYLELLKTGKVELMPGVKPLLEALEKENIRRCIVTHSFREQAELIASFLPILKTVSHWVTREEYTEPKPNPEPYLKAISLYGKKGDRIIGFEDSVRGFKALKASPAQAVLIAESNYPLLDVILDEHESVCRYESFSAIPVSGP
jgi:beta-phosphoglucomutase